MVEFRQEFVSRANVAPKFSVFSSTRAKLLWKAIVILYDDSSNKQYVMLLLACNNGTDWWALLDPCRCLAALFAILVVGPVVGGLLFTMSQASTAQVRSINM